MQPDFNETMNSLSEDAKLALQKADYFSKSYNSGYMGTEHILLGICGTNQSTGAHLLAEQGIDIDTLEKTMDSHPQEVRGSEMAMMSLSESAVLTLRMAAAYCHEQGAEVIGTEHLLYALVAQPTSRACIMLKKLEVNLDEFADAIEAVVEENALREINKSKQNEYIKTNEFRFLKRFGVDLVKISKEEKLDHVIGREREIERVITVLCRRTKSNPVLIGEAGVGKTAIIEGLAQRIAADDVPSTLIGKHIYQIDLSGMVAGTKFRGEFEERIKGVIDEASNHPDVILFIDELHLLAGAGAGTGDAMDAANILKPALARGWISLIGATTLDEYRQNIEKDKALSRRFQTVIVDEPTDTVTYKILKGIKKHYEKHHGVEIPDELLKTAIHMSGRYINDRYMPDKVIDVIDEACAIAKVNYDKKDGGKYKKLKIEEKSLQEKIEAAAEAEDYEKAANLKTTQAKIQEDIKKLEKKGVEKDQQPTLTEEDLTKAISLKTGIPVSRVHGSERDLLLKLEDHIDAAIIGQDEAVAAVSRAIRRGRSGIANPHRPIGSFLFMGPTGVGKTELARVIAKEVFGGENSLIKIDMSEYGEKHNVSRLIGAPAGYVGYEDGGKLTEAVRRHPYSVILFDEIEKAHPDLFNILLQILEDGVLTDGQGTKVKFNNTIVILTSNLGSRDISNPDDFGFSSPKRKKTKADLAAEYELQKEQAMRALKKSMRPELINRLDAILFFRSLTERQVSQIFNTMLEDLKKRLGTNGIGLKLSNDARKEIIRQGYDPKNGARPLRRAIENNLEALISDDIISGKLKKGDIALVSIKNKKLNLSITKE